MPLADHAAALGVERREERRGPVAHVVVSPPLHLARAPGQPRLTAVQRLDLRLLVHAQHQRLIRRVQIQPDDVAHLVDEQRIRRQRERLAPMRLQAEGAPDPTDGTLTQATLARHGPRAPVRRVPRRGLQGQRHDALHRGIGHGPRRPRSRLIQQSIEALRDEATPPLADGLLGYAQLSSHGGVCLSGGAFENHTGPQGGRLRRLRTASPVLECLTFFPTDDQLPERSTCSRRGTGRDPSA